MGEIAEATGKAIGLFFDALTPRSFRLFLVLILGLLTWGWWANREELKAQRTQLEQYKVGVAGIQAVQELILKRVDEGNSDLRDIRKQLYDTKAIR